MAGWICQALLEIKIEKVFAIIPQGCAVILANSVL